MEGPRIINFVSIMKVPAPSHLRPIVAALAVCALATLSQCSADNAVSGAGGAAEKDEVSRQVASAETTTEPTVELAKRNAPEITGKPLAVAAADFGKFLEASDGVVLVDFWAEWCQPCHLIAPEVDKVADRYAGRVQVVKVDLTEAPGDGFSAKYGIDFLPTVMIFKDGKSQGNLVINGRPMPDATGISAALDKQL